MLVAVLPDDGRGAVLFFFAQDGHAADILRRIIRVGKMAGIQGMVFSISTLWIQSGINSFGAASIAGNTAAQNFEHICYFVINLICAGRDDLYQSGILPPESNGALPGEQQVVRIDRVWHQRLRFRSFSMRGAAFILFFTEDSGGHPLCDDPFPLTSSFSNS